MKCLYYLTSTLDSSSHIADDLHQAGIKDWFIHFLSKDESGLKRGKLHSSNYLERLDILRYGLLGILPGFFGGWALAAILDQMKVFGPELPGAAYYAIVFLAALFGVWEGGLIGIASENKKIAVFHDDLEAGNYLIMIYARKAMEERVKSVMTTRHPEARLAAMDTLFYNPFAELERLDIGYTETLARGRTGS